MKKPLVIRNVEIGAGTPKIVVPIVAQSWDALANQAAQAVQAGADMLEWRADYLCTSETADEFKQQLPSYLPLLREAAGSVPVIFTFRSFDEGGHGCVGFDFTNSVLRMAIESGQVDVVDIELANPALEDCLNFAQNQGLATIVSSHNFLGTPSYEDMYATFQAAYNVGASICKLAVMAQEEGDELSLMATANQFAEDYPDAILLAISMGELGAITRVAGEFFGSALTFCTAGKASAPGQIDIATARATIAQLHEEGYNPSSIE